MVLSRQKMSRFKVLAAIAATAGAVSLGADQALSQSSDLIQIDGSSTVFPITEAIAEEFMAQSDARVTVGVSGTGGGFERFCAGETDISNASRPIKETEIEACEAAGVDYVVIPVATDAITVVVSQENAFLSELTVEQLQTLWEPAAEGTVTRWNQLDSSFPDEEISLYGPGPDSGTFDYFTEEIVGEEDASRGDYTASEDDNVLVLGVSGDPNALGYFGMSYYLENQDILKAVGIDNGDGVVVPSPENIEEYSPLSRPIFIYVSTDSLERPEVRAFVEYYLEQAPTIVPEVGYVALPDEKYEESLAEL